MVAFYSLELLIVFAALFAYFQKTSRMKRGIVFISLIPLAMAANILRVLWACGLAMNDGIVSADKSFYGILAGSVFAFIIVGLIILESISPATKNGRKPMMNCALSRSCGALIGRKVRR